MSKANLGTKRACRKCNVNFYDLNKDPIECPKCLTTFSMADYASKYLKGSDARDKKENKKMAAAFEEDVVLIDSEDIEENILDDDSDVELADAGVDGIDLKDEKLDSN